MADISVTAANVGMSTSTPSRKMGTAGETLTEGELVYLKAADNKYWLANADDVDAATAVIAGVVITPASAEEKVEIVTKGIYDCGATVVVGVIYVLSELADGGFGPHTDLAAGANVSIFGFGATTSTIEVAITNTGYTHG